MRLLVVGNGPTGISKDGEVHVDLTVGHLLMDLAQVGMDVTFAQPTERLSLNLNYYGCILPPDKVAHISLDSSRLLSSLLTGLRLLWSLLRADFIYLFYPGKLPRLVAPICHFLRKRYAVYLRGNQFGNADGDVAILRRAEFVTVTSPSIAARARPFNDAIELIRPMFDLSIGDPFPREHRQLRTGPIRLLFVGRIEADKGVPELLEAARILSRRDVDFELSLVGWGDLRQKVADELGLFPDLPIRLPGAIEDRAELMHMYEAADIFVLPTHHEGFPRVLCEAMLKSTAIVTTMVGGIPEIMEGGTNCLDVPVEDPVAIAAAIELLARDPALRQRLVDGGHQTMAHMRATRPNHLEVLRKRVPAAIAAEPGADDGD